MLENNSIVNTIKLSFRNRFLFLILFELRKIFSKKKAIFFILAINIPHILYTLVLFYNYPYDIFGGTINENLRHNLDSGIRMLYIIHIFMFFWISPFYMTLFVSDVVSDETTQGYLKTLLLTPVKRWQILVSKFLAVIFILLTAYVGGFIYMLLWVKILNLNLANNLLLSFESFKALYLIIIANVTVTTMLFILAVVIDSPISMSFISFFTLFFLVSFELSIKYESLWQQYGIIRKLAEWSFVKQIISIPLKLVVDFQFEKIKVDASVMNEANYLIFCSLLFFSISLWLFSKKEINA